MIFCFSATGNSQYAAERIASVTEEKIISINVAIKDNHYDFDVSNEEYIGFVLPTFAYTLPGVAAQYIEKMQLTGVSNQYVYGVFTCGAGTGDESGALRDLLASKGIGYNGGYGIAMIDNYIIWSSIPSDEMISRRLDAVDMKLNDIAASIKAKLPADVGGRVRDAYMPLEHIKNGNTKFTVSNTCTSCGLCSEQCPTGCIKLSENGKPYWDGECTMCLGCLHRCPAAAIDYGRDTAGKRRYINPRVIIQTKNEY